MSLQPHCSLAAQSCASSVIFKIALCLRSPGNSAESCVSSVYFSLLFLFLCSCSFLLLSLSCARALSLFRNLRVYVLIRQCHQGARWKRMVASHHGKMESGFLCLFRVDAYSSRFAHENASLSLSLSLRHPHILTRSHTYSLARSLSLSLSLWLAGAPACCAAACKQSVVARAN